MSHQLNIGTVGVAAVKNLRGNPHFEKLVEILGDTTYNMCHALLDQPPENRVVYSEYARGVRDIWRQFDSALKDIRIGLNGPTKDGKPGKPQTPPTPLEDPIAAISALAGGAPPSSFAPKA